MKEIKGPLNPELLEIVSEFSDWFFKQDRSLIRLNGEPDKDEYNTSIEYLESIDKVNHIGYPEITHGADLNNFESTPLAWREHIQRLDNNLNAFLGARMCAVKMYYPDGGYMGWHDNHNVPGYNILMHFSPEGGGFFRYKDPKTKEIVTLIDDKGWSAKVGYFGEGDDAFWHCARSKGERLTLGYVIPDENMWNMMVEDLAA